MRTLKLHFADDALPTVDTFIKQTKEARVFRRAQAVRHVVKGQRLQTVSDTLAFTSSALRTWVHRCASQGVQGLVDRPRSGRPPKMPCELEQHLNRLVDHAPLQPGSLHAQWSCRALAPVLARETGVQLGRESVRGVVKKTREASTGPRADWLLPRLISPPARSHSPPSNTRRAAGRSFCSMKTTRSSGVLPCLAPAGGAPPSARAFPPAR